MERRAVVRFDLEARNQRILILYSRHIHRKRIALMMGMHYDAVKKVIQRYLSPIRREITPQIESYDTFFHSER